jgi:putative hydrolases of HD superfamily
VQSDVRDPESVADHMYRMATMALLMAGSEAYNQPKLVKMAVVHDIAEAIVGDITPADDVSKEDKQAREADAMLQIQDMLGKSTRVAQEVGELWYGSASQCGIMCQDMARVTMCCTYALLVHM